MEINQQSNHIIKITVVAKYDISNELISIGASIRRIFIYPDYTYITIELPDMLLSKVSTLESVIKVNPLTNYNINNEH